MSHIYIMETEQNINPEQKNQTGDVRQKIKKYFLITWEFLQIILLAAVIVLPIRYFIFQPFIVKGDSMVPNFHSGDYLIVDEISYRFSNPARGDVVVFRYPLDESERFIKRIIGLPGETVEVKDGKITITSQDGNYASILNEKSYLPDLLSTDGAKKITLKTDEYFVLGDNRQFSYDSRSWGVLPKDELIGKAAFRLLPIEALSYIPTPAYQSIANNN